MTDKKKKTLRILFSLTFIPYILILALSTLAAFVGFGFMTHQEIGFEAFMSVFEFLTVGLIMIPIIPVCFAIQLTALINKIRKIPVENVSAKKFILSTVLFTAAFLIIVFGGTFLSQVIADKMLDSKITKQYKKSEEIIVYNCEYTTGHEIAGKSYPGDVILLDWDNKEVALVYSYTSNPLFKKYELEEVSEDDFENILSKDDYNVKSYDFGDYSFQIYSIYDGGANIFCIRSLDGKIYVYELEQNISFNIRIDS